MKETMINKVRKTLQSFFNHIISAPLSNDELGLILQYLPSEDILQLAFTSSTMFNIISEMVENHLAKYCVSESQEIREEWNLVHCKPKTTCNHKIQYSSSHSYCGGNCRSKRFVMWTFRSFSAILYRLILVSI